MMRKLIKLNDSKKRTTNPTVQNPAELLTGLAEGLQVKEPVKQELIKASAARIENKLTRSK
jgi:hypothetical protein